MSINLIREVIYYVQKVILVLDAKFVIQLLDFGMNLMQLMDLVHVQNVVKFKVINGLWH